MKYKNFKIFKFSTIYKKIDPIRYIYSRIYKNIKTIPVYYDVFFNLIKKNIFLKIIKFIKFIIRYFLSLFEYLNFQKLDLKKSYKYLDIRRYNFYKIRRYNFYKINRKIDLINFRHLKIYFFFFIVATGFIYLVVPTFYSYDKLEIEKVICKNKNVKCSIKGKVTYSFYPTPRIKIIDLIINDGLEKTNTIATVKNAAIKLSIKNLLFKEKHKFKKVKLNDFKINVNLKNFKKYKNIFTEKINFIPTVFADGQIILTNGKDYVATISDAKLNLMLEKNSKESTLKGKFLDDSIFISINNEKIDNKSSTDIILKMYDLNLVTKANFFNLEKTKDKINGNISIKKNKNKFTGIFAYNDNEITIKKSNLRNIFSEGKLKGKIKFLPYFNFNLELDLNSVNFTKLYNYFLAIDEKKREKLFKINEKINGKLSFSSDKIYSSYNLVKSFESRIKFNNGNIIVEQFLFNLGKLGAADILGTINNEKKLSNFKYESNIFVDNEKKFSSKFGIYNKQNIPPNLFVSGNFDLKNIRISFYEISGDKIFNGEDVNYIEKEFNDLMLEDGYSNLFHFPRFKEFVKSITSDNN